jgi:hypothetical protein
MVAKKKTKKKPTKATRTAGKNLTPKKELAKKRRIPKKKSAKIITPLIKENATA